MATPSRSADVSPSPSTSSSATATIVPSALRPPYELSSLEQRALDSHEWILVLDEATHRTWFFNPSTREATRNLHPILVERCSISTKTNATASATPVRSATDGPSSRLAASAVVSPLPSQQQQQQPTVEALIAELSTTRAEVQEWKAVARQQEDEVLFLRHALLHKCGVSLSYKEIAEALRPSTLDPDAWASNGALSLVRHNPMHPDPSSTSKLITVARPNNTLTKIGVSSEYDRSSDPAGVAYFEKRIQALQDLNLRLLCALQERRGEAPRTAPRW